MTYSVTVQQAGQPNYSPTKRGYWTKWTEQVRYVARYITKNVKIGETVTQVAKTETKTQKTTVTLMVPLADNSAGSKLLPVIQVLTQDYMVPLTIGLCAVAWQILKFSPTPGRQETRSCQEQQDDEEFEEENI